MTGREAIKELRAVMGISQETLARQLNVTVRTIARYEKEGPQVGKLLSKLATLAVEQKRGDLAVAFADTVMTNLARLWFKFPVFPRTNQEFRICLTVLEILRREKFAAARTTLHQVVLPVMEEKGFFQNLNKDFERFDEDVNARQTIKSETQSTRKKPK